MALDRLYVTLAICALLLGTHVGAWIHGRNHERDAQEQKAKVIELAQVKAVAEANAQTSARQVTLAEDRTKANDEANKRIAQATADAAAARTELERLRVALTSRPASRGTVRQDTAAVCQCETDTTASRLFLRCAERYTRLDESATADRIAGLKCNDEYDAAYKALGEVN